MALTNTQAIDYALYDRNNRQGKVPWLDIQADRDACNAEIRRVLGIGA